jgi:germination protein M
MSRTVRGALLATLLAVLAACGIPTDGEPRPLADETPTSTPDTAPADADTSAAVYLVRATNALGSVRRGLSGPRSPVTVLEALLAPPSDEELEDGLSTAVPLGTTVLEVVQDDDLVSVDLSDEWDSLVQPNALLAYAQVVLTLTDLNGVERVRFLVDGEGVAAPTINQGDLDTVTADDYAGLDPG